MRKIFELAAVAALAVVASCAGRGDQPQPVRVERLDIALSDSVAIPGVIGRYAPALGAVAMSQGLTADDPESVAGQILSRPYFAVFAPDVRRVFPDLDGLESRLALTLTRLADVAGREAVPGRIYAYVSPYNQAIVTVDTVMLVALNHYLGPDYPGYQSFDGYQRAVKTPDRIVYDMAEAILSARFPYDETAYSSVLSRMLYEGVLVYAMMQTVDRPDLAAALGWNAEQLKWAEANEGQTWRRLAADGLLFSSSKMDAARLVAPSPATSIIDPAAPGRLGRYTGYRIVESYMKSHPSTPLDRLLSPAFFNGESTLREAAYAP